MFLISKIIFLPANLIIVIGKIISGDQQKYFFDQQKIFANKVQYLQFVTPSCFSCFTKWPWLFMKKIFFLFLIDEGYYSEQ